MIERLLGNVSTWIVTSPLLALLAVFVGGLLTATNPCVLATVPLSIGFVASARERGMNTRRAFGYSLAFVLGLSLTYVALGTFAALAGRLYGEVSSAWTWVIAAVCLAMGAHLLGLVEIPLSLPVNVSPKRRGFLGAVILGALFGVVSAPCAAPVLLVLLTYLAGAGSSVAWGALLLFVYSLGHSVLVLVAGTSAGAARGLLESRRVTDVTARLRKVTGVAVLFLGMYYLAKGIFR